MNWYIQLSRSSWHKSKASCVRCCKDTVRDWLLLQVYSSRSPVGHRAESPPWLPEFLAWSAFLCHTATINSVLLSNSFLYVYILCAPSLIRASVYFTVVRNLDFILNATGSHNLLPILKDLSGYCTDKRLEGAKSRGRKTSWSAIFNSPGEVMLIWIHPMDMEKTGWIWDIFGRSHWQDLLMDKTWGHRTGKNSWVNFTTTFFFFKAEVGEESEANWLQRNVLFILKHSKL